jgi:TPR repeat protein
MGILRVTILGFAVGALLGPSIAESEPQKSADEVADYLETYRADAQVGLPEEQYDLGASYRWGVGIEKNLILAVRWIHQAAEQGYPIAERTIGEMYEKGEGLPANPEEALHWYRRAAQHGDSIAQKDLEALDAKIHPLPAASDSQ